MHTAQELVACVEGLWSLPNAYYRVREALEDPDLGTDDLAQMISTDPGMAASLLRLANSAFFGFPRRIDTLSRAISLIGLDQVSEVLLASALAATFNAFSPRDVDMRRFWRDSVRRALLCRDLVRHTGHREGERLFVAGLLSETGHLVMFHAVPEQMGQLTAKATGGLLSLAAQERDTVGCDFTEVGAALAAAWRLPASLGVLIGAQLTPPHAGQLARDAALLHIAAVLSDGAEREEPLDTTLGHLHSEALSLAHVVAEDLSSIATNAAAQLDDVLAELGLKH